MSVVTSCQPIRLWPQGEWFRQWRRRWSATRDEEAPPSDSTQWRTDLDLLSASEGIILPFTKVLLDNRGKEGRRDAIIVS